MGRRSTVHAPERVPDASQLIGPLVPLLDKELQRQTGLPLAWYDVLLELNAADGGRLRMGELGDAVVFGAPTYMGAASSAFKKFAEATSAPWGDGLRWKDKVAGGFTNSQNINGNKENTLLELFVLAAQHGMHWVALGEYAGWNTTAGSPDDLNRLGSFTGAMAQSDGDAGPDVAPPAADLATAKALGQRVAEVARDYTAGRRATGAA